MRAEADLNRGPSAYQPNALPLGQTGSPIANVSYRHFIPPTSPSSPTQKWLMVKKRNKLVITGFQHPASCTGSHQNNRKQKRNNNMHVNRECDLLLVSLGTVFIQSEANSRHFSFPNISVKQHPLSVCTMCVCVCVCVCARVVVYCGVCVCAHGVCVCLWCVCVVVCVCMCTWCMCVCVCVCIYILHIISYVWTHVDAYIMR